MASPDRAVAPLPSQGVPELAAERAKADVLLRALGADTSSLQAELGHWSPWQVVGQRSRTTGLLRSVAGAKKAAHGTVFIRPWHVWATA